MINKLYKIRFTGGLGDCLKMIMEQTSLVDLNKHENILIYWVYSDMNLVDIVYKQFNGSKILNGQWSYIRDYDLIDYNHGNEKSVNGAYPVHQALYDLLQHYSPPFQLVSQNAFANLDVIELDNWRSNSYPGYSYDTQLKGKYPNEKGGWEITAKDELVDSLLTDCEYSFCVQLSGSNQAKQYEPSNYVKLFKLILDKYPNSKIMLIDRPNFIVDPSILFDDRIINLVGKVSIFQCALLIQKSSYLIAPDSYSKYIRKWVDGKQSILCTKLDCHPNVAQMLQDAFNYVGLLNDPNIKILGTSFQISNNVVSEATIVNSINDITPEEIFKTINI